MAFDDETEPAYTPPHDDHGTRDYWQRGLAVLFMLAALCAGPHPSFSTTTED